MLQCDAQFSLAGHACQGVEHSEARPTCGMLFGAERITMRGDFYQQCTISTAIGERDPLLALLRNQK
jgi:hypothetical protein